MKKICTQCKIEKSYDEFYNQADGPGGCKTACKNCTKKYNESRKKEISDYNKKYWKRIMELKNAAVA